MSVKNANNLLAMRDGHGDLIEGVIEAEPVLPVDAVVEVAWGSVTSSTVEVPIEERIGAIVIPPPPTLIDCAVTTGSV